MKKSTKLIIGIISALAIICVAAVLVFAGAGKEKSEYDKHITASQKYLDELNYEKAIAELEVAMEIEPNNAQGYIALAEVYVQMGEYESAVLVLEEAKERVDSLNDVVVALDSIKEKVEEKKDETIVEQEWEPDVIELNKYLSFFRFYRMDEYSAENPNYSNLLNFVFEYMRLAEIQKVNYQNGNESISKTDINEFLQQYFDITIPEEDFGVFTYADGKFYSPAAASGDIGTPISIAEEIVINDNGNYDVTFTNVYIYGEDFETGEINTIDIEDYYKYTMEQIKKDPFCEIEETGKCEIKRLDGRLILLEYILNNAQNSFGEYSSFKDMLLCNTFYQPGEQDFFFRVYRFEEDGYVYGENCNVDGSMTWGEQWSSPYIVQGTSVIIDNSITYSYKEDIGVLATDISMVWDEWNEVYSKEVKWMVPYNGELSIDIYTEFANYYFELID